MTPQLDGAVQERATPASRRVHCRYCALDPALARRTHCVPCGFASRVDPCHGCAAWAAGQRAAVFNLVNVLRLAEQIADRASRDRVGDLVRGLRRPGSPMGGRLPRRVALRVPRRAGRHRGRPPGVRLRHAARRLGRVGQRMLPRPRVRAIAGRPARRRQTLR